MLDLLVRGGVVIDGSGSPGKIADVAVIGDRIVEVSPSIGADARTVIEARGRCVTPGFIDTHAHSELALLADPQHAPKVRQGVTTEILGQDGLSFAPLSPANLAFYLQYLAGAYGYPDLEATWSSVAEFRAMYDGTVAVNTAYLVPHGAVRLEVAGMRDVPLDADLLARARHLVETGLADGAVGFSTGLSYFPGSYGDTAEIAALCEPVTSAGGVYVTHIRTVFRDGQFDPVQEALEIGRRSGVKVHISHFRTDEWNAGQVVELMQPIEDALEKGEDITLDIYPYPSGSGFGLAILPSWVHQGSVDDMVALLRDEPTRSRIMHEMRGAAGVSPVAGQAGSVERLISHVGSPRNTDLLGLTYSQAAERRGRPDPLEMLVDLLVDERLEVGMVVAPPDDATTRRMEADLMYLLSRPYYMVGSDSISVGGHPHPRLYGAFPRLLGTLRRRHPGAPLETLVNRATDAAARRFRLRDRGLVRAGAFADLVVFDPDTIEDRATYAQPIQAPVGIGHVVVNGQIAVADGEPTGVLAGRAIP